MSCWLVLLLGLSSCGRSPPAPVPDLGQAHASAQPPRHPAAVASALPSATALPRVAAAPSTPPAEPRPRRRFAGGGPQSVSGRLGLVTSSEAQATRAGVAMLEQGGNAVDAAVATAFALAVTHPSAGNIGGGGFILVRAPGRDAVTTAIDFRETAPAALTRAGFDKMQRGGAKGGAAAGVPGSVAGLLMAHERFGKLTRADVLAPAIALAQKGFVLARRQAELLAASYDALDKDATLAKRFGKDKKPRGQGSRIVQPELARALLRIQADGAAGFYSGPTALALTRAPGSLISLQDLERYKAVERTPLRSTYRGLGVETMPPPSAGGVAVTEMLGLLELLRAHEADGAQELHFFLEACRRAQAERRFGVSDPDGLDASALENALLRFTSPDALLARAPIERERATPSSALTSLYPGAETESEQTTHLSVVDQAGMVVSLTTTLSASFGAKVTAPGTGVVLNNSVASFSNRGPNQPAPGRRTTSSMAPTLLLDDGQVVLVLGTPGGDTIPSTIVQVLRHVVDHGFALDRAVAAPRLHQSFLPDRARFETKRPLEPELVKALKTYGHALSGSHLAMGDSNDILLEDEQAYAVADPRGGGLALAATNVVAPPEPAASASPP
ncbi:MAG TPA: gamma-glutamyltransferase [Polyangiaceae bacterium]|nr:gamma-glutamyltransferase [Polyangiaceae bacterium]